MGAGTGGVRGEGACTGAGSHTRFHRPIDSGRIERGCGYIGKVTGVFSSIKACCSPDIQYRHAAGARGIPVKGCAIAARVRKNVVLFGPQCRFIKIIAGLDVAERIGFAGRFG